MAQLKLSKGSKITLEYPAKVEGQLLFNTETGVIYLDKSGTERVEFYKAPLDKINAAIKTLEDLVGDGALEDAIEAEIKKLANDDAAEAHKFVTEVSQENGIVSVFRAALAEADIPNLAISKITGLQTALDAKQDELGIVEGYDKDSNPVATKDYVDEAVEEATAGLEGALHYVGESTTDPVTAGATIADNDGYTPTNGDVCTYAETDKEYIYANGKWREFGAEGSYLIKNSNAVTNSDVADGALSQAKISGLTTKLEGIDTNAKSISDLKTTVDAIDVEGDITDALAELTNTDAEVTDQFVTAVKQENGKITVTRKAVPMGALEWGTFDV